MISYERVVDNELNMNMNVDKKINYSYTFPKYLKEKMVYKNVNSISFPPFQQLYYDYNSLYSYLVFNCCNISGE